MSILIGLVIAAIVGFLVAQDANKRGMNGAGWGIGTFLFCIIFLPLYLIMRKPLINDVSQGNTSSLCPTCGKYYAGSPAFCPLCGAPQTDDFGRHTRR